MGYQTRLKLYEEFEKQRKKPLIVYVTSIRVGTSAQMASDALPQIIEQINNVPEACRDVDFLIISNGGDSIVAQRIISILRERFDKISVILPYVAYSAATVLALGADEIVMHPYSNLGPVDPQILIVKPNNVGQQTQSHFSSEDIRNYIEFIRSDVGISDQAQLIQAFNGLASEVGPIQIGISKRSQQLMLSLSEKMLETHMDDKQKVASIVKALNSSYYHHGYPVGRKEAKDIGLNVIFPVLDIEKLMWAIWLDFCSEMKCNHLFDLVSEILNDPVAKQFLSTYQVVSMPINTPLPIGQNIMAKMAQDAARFVPHRPIEIVCPIAAIESTRKMFAVSTLFHVVYWRDINMTLAFNYTAYSKGWEEVSN